MSEIKAIETEYAGCRFRSRLEARWAVFFDALGIKWHYEEEGYELPSGRYLPDFRLEATGLQGEEDIWVEVKGKLDGTGAARLLRAALELPSSRPGRMHGKILVLGAIPEPTGSPVHMRLDALGDCVAIQRSFFAFIWRGREMAPYVTAIGDAQWVRVAALLESSQSTDWLDWLAAQLIAPEPDPFILPFDRVLAAYRAARSARFEFGQSGAL